MTYEVLLNKKLKVFHFFSFTFFQFCSLKIIKSWQRIKKQIIVN